MAVSIVLFMIGKTTTILVGIRTDTAITEMELDMKIVMDTLGTDGIN